MYVCICILKGSERNIQTFSVFFSSVLWILFAFKNGCDHILFFFIFFTPIPRIYLGWFFCLFFVFFLHLFSLRYWFLLVDPITLIWSGWRVTLRMRYSLWGFLCEMQTFLIHTFSLFNLFFKESFWREELYLTVSHPCFGLNLWERSGNFFALADCIISLWRLSHCTWLHIL